MQDYDEFEEFGASDDVELADLFNHAFMMEFTEFDSFGDFLEAGGFVIESQADLDDLDISAMDEWVELNTQFDSWETMQGEALAIYTLNELGL